LDSSGNFERNEDAICREEQQKYGKPAKFLRSRAEKISAEVHAKVFGKVVV
jgi:hypothetical protein